MATTMKAINISGIGGLDVLVSSTVPVPTPGPEDVLINVKAVSINPVEAKIRAGKWAGGTMPAGSILGFDAAGVIAGVGSSVGSAFKAGDEVYFLGSTLPTKSNAEYALVDYRAVALKPKTASFEDAAGLPLVGLTAWELVVEQLKVGQDDESEGGAVLIVNGAGGVGSVASQLVRSVSGVSTVITTASRSESIAHTKSLGATHTISHRPEAGSLKSQIDKLGLGVPV
jgi:NADPH:quinone reductase-like Zn-dependent oxidoreductase